MISITKEEWYKLQSDFIKRFPLESLKEISIEQYTNLNRSDSFCYWLESITTELGSIWGGSSYKFGIYKYDNEPQSQKDCKDDEYAWHAKFGNDRHSAFEAVRHGLYEIATAAAKSDFEAVESNSTFGDACKWKIAFIYSGMKLIPLYKKNMLQKICKEWGMNASEKATICEMHHFLIEQKADKDLYDFYNEILAMLNVLSAEGSVWMYKGDEKTFEQDAISMGDTVSEGLVDYSSFQTRKEMGNAYRKVRGNTDVSVPFAYWQFMKDVKIGDVVVVFANRREKKNTHLLYGWGIVSSELINDLASKSPLQRRIEWKERFEEPVQENIVSNSLFFHGMDKEKTEKIKQLLGITPESIEITYKKDMNIQEYISLLEENHNLVLTGAPGTGKTYLAKQIAKAMGTEENLKNFVQFHPSYDYTDFVEGLRPSREGDGFERRDGVFKTFCKHAIMSYLRADNNIFEGLNDEPTIWKVSLWGAGENPIRTDCMKKNRIRIGWDEYGDVDFNDFEDFSNGGKNILKAFYNDMKIGDIVISCYGEYKTDAIGIVTGDYEYLAEDKDMRRCRDVHWLMKGEVHDTHDLLGKKMTMATVYRLDVSLQKVMDFVKQHYKHNTQPLSESRQKHVFIIDEINRGDLSKIFGELFFSIDPGYRGKEGLVQTQYQNMIDPADVFAEGFYIPENVYIIATMNDIDRNVESMDFAMRRRFTWVEVTPDDRLEMLEKLPQKEEAKLRMQSLNKAIAETDGLGHAFQIGPAYFLKLKNGDFNRLWKLNIEPLLKEYLRGFRKAGETLKKFRDAYNIIDE